MLVRNPAEEEYRKIFERFCDSRGLECPEGALDRLIANRYQATRRPMRRCQPRDLISHAIDFIQFEDRPWLLDDDVLDRAWESCFADSRDLDG